MQLSGWTAPHPEQSVAFGIPMEQAVGEAVHRLAMNRVVVVAANSLAQPGGLAERVARALGANCHAIASGVRPHSPRSEVVRIARILSQAGGVITIGGGSVCDTVKAARLCLANGIDEPDALDRLRPYNRPASEGDEAIASPTLPFAAIMTTLSASEFTAGAGVTDERGPVKRVYVYPRLAPDIVIVDPDMTMATPPRLWFASGLRAVDHAIETWCSTNPSPLSDAYSLRAAQLLLPSLRRGFDHPDDAEARLACMTGAWLSILGPAAGVKAGASHGIGHALGGTTGMGHGETSCVMLPHVLRFNAAVNGERQAVLAAQIDAPAKPLCEMIRDLVAHLQLPARLRDAGVAREALRAVADAALHDSFVAANPRPLTSAEDVEELLQRAW